MIENSTNVGLAVDCDNLKAVGKTRINLEEIYAIAKRRGEINRLDLRYVEFYRDGKLVEVTDEMIQEHRFAGLDNFHFVEFFIDGTIEGEDGIEMPAIDYIRKHGTIESRYEIGNEKNKTSI